MRLMIHVRMTNIDDDQQMSFHIPEFEYSKSSFLLLKRIILERNFNLHTDLSVRMQMFPTYGYLLGELDDISDVDYCYNHKRKRYDAVKGNEEVDIYDLINGHNVLSSTSTLTEVSSDSDEPGDWSDEPPLKKAANRRTFEDMNGDYQTLNLHDCDMIVSGTDETVSFMDMLENPRV